MQRQGQQNNIIVGQATQLEPEAGLEEIARHKAYCLLRDKAYEYLARREHSEYELRRKLERFDQYEQVETLIEALTRQGALSDERFAAHIGRVRANAGKGPVFLQNELDQHRIASEVIEAVMESYVDQWQELAEKARQKKFGASYPDNYKGWSKQSRFLQQRGFTSAHIPDFRS